MILDWKAVKEKENIMIKLESTVTCPNCTYVSKEKMPVSVCVRFYECKGCGYIVIPLAGDCCIFCSYGDIKCPPVQKELEDSTETIIK